MAYAVQSNSWVLYLIIFFCLVFIGIGIGMLVKLMKNFSKARLSKNWLATPGNIISSELDAQTTTDEDGYQTTTYIANILFEYQVNKASFKCDCINFDYGMRTSNRSKQQAIVEQYPAGSQVTVYYDPDDPEQAVLEKRVNGVFTTIMVSAVFILIGIIVAVMSLGVNPPAFLKNMLGN
ncbi:MAG: DUF3592 domain-containing protein [Anaerolineaceae bacterium]|nr:DUF3592 domain-containing protein [Anaerolineaceae bacterium]